MNDLVTLQDELAALGTAKYMDDRVFGAIAVSTAFLPRLQLFGAANKEVKKGLIPMAHYGLVRQKDQIEDLGSMVDVVAFSVRAQAIRFNDGDDNVRAIYNHQDPEFIRIQQESMESESGCAFGPQFILWVPTCSTPCFATFFFGSKSARGEAPPLKALIGKAATFKSRLAENKKGQSWHVPVVTPCSTWTHQLPPMEDIKREVEKFNNPPEAEQQVAAPQERVR